MIVHSRYVEARARERRLRRAGLAHPAPGLAGRRRRAGAVDGRPALRLLRAPEREQAHPAAARGVRARPRARIPARGCCSSAPTRRGFDLDGGSSGSASTRAVVIREDYVDGGAALGADGARATSASACARRRWARPPARAIRALSLGQAARRQRPRLVRGAAGRRRAQGAGRRARGRDARRRARAARRRAAAARRDGRGRARATPRREHDARPRRRRSTPPRSRRRPAAPAVRERGAPRGRRGAPPTSASRPTTRSRPSSPSGCARSRCRVSAATARPRRDRALALAARRAGAGSGSARSSSSRPRSASRSRAAWSAPWIMVDELDLLRAREELRRGRPLPRPRRTRPAPPTASSTRC